jgi:hypothetical protein
LLVAGVYNLHGPAILPAVYPSFSTAPGGSAYSIQLSQNPLFPVNGDFVLILAAAPEPGPLALACVAAGVAGVAAWRRRRKIPRPVADARGGFQSP